MADNQHQPTGRIEREQPERAPTSTPGAARQTEHIQRPAAGRLQARPQPAGQATQSGVHRLGLARERDALLYVPQGYRAEQPAPLVLMLHGAGGDAGGALAPLQGLADAAGLLLLAPPSRGRTWDVILGRYGPDVAFIDQALAETFRRCTVDAARLGIAGFSDGASYALSLGLTNGDLFSHVIAFSPGFMQPASLQGAPPIYISHGTGDTVLPIDRCSRRIVPALEQGGYQVRYHEFAGGHTVPGEIASEALQWLLGTGG